MNEKLGIDCLFINHYDIDFNQYEQTIRKMGLQSGAYRDLFKNFIQYNGKLYHISDLYNYLMKESKKDFQNFLYFGDTFSSAIAYLGTYLSKSGLSFDYINSVTYEKENLIKKLQDENILTIAIITTLYVSVFPLIEIMKIIKQYNIKAKVIIGGPFISTQVRSLNTYELDFLFQSIQADFYINSSQGEETLVKLINAIKNNSSIENINNIYYRTKNGFIGTEIRIEDNKLSENMVNWNLFSGNINYFVNIRTSISCPFKCAFCSFPEHAGNYQTVSVEHIEKELQILNGLHRVKNVFFTDDTFNVPVKRFKEILRMLIKNKFEFEWYSNFRCQFADEEMMQLMKDSGCIGVFLGIESGNDQILNNMNKSVTVDKYYKGINLLKKYNIITHGSFIVGFPGETYDSVNDSIKLINECELDFYRAQLWYCERITPIWNRRDEFQINGSQYEWNHATMDSKTACDLIDNMFLSIKKSVWIPQYNFDFVQLIHLLYKNLNIDNIKNFLRAFNEGVKEKFINGKNINHDNKEINYNIISQMKGILNLVEINPIKDNKLINKFNADFDFL